MIAANPSGTKTVRDFFDRTRRLVFLIVGLLAVFIAGNFALESYSLYRSDQQDAAVRIDGYNKLIAEQLDSTLLNIGGVMAHVVEVNRRALQSRAAPDWNELLLAAHAGLISANVLVRMGPDGVVLQATNPAFVGRSARPGSVFFRLRDGAGGTVVADEAVRGPVSGVFQVTLGRRIEDAQGQFQGAVLGTLDLDRLSALYGTLKLEPGIVVEVRHVNGNRLLRVGADGTKPAEASPAQFITSLRRLEHFPVVVAVSIDRSQVLAAWRRHLAGNGAATVAVLSALLAAAFFISKQLRHQQLSGESLRESEERYRRTFEFAGVGFVHLAIDGTMLRVNRQFRKMLGYHTDELLGRNVRELSHPDDVAAGDPARARMRAGGLESGRFEKRYLRKDGSPVWAAVTIVLIRDEDSAPLYEISVIEDVTERKRAAQALVASERRFRALIENTSDGIALFDARGVLVYRSPSSVRITGYTDEQRLGGYVEEFVHAEDVPALRAAFHAVLHDPARAERVVYRFQHAGGGWLWIDGLVSNLLHQPDVGSLVMNYRDVTGRKQADERLAENEARLRRFRTAMDISGDAILLVDRTSMRYIDVNRTFCDLVGYTREELLGKSPLDLFSASRESLERDYDAIIADEGSSASTVEGFYHRKDGTQVPVEARRRALHTDAGWIIVSTARDITERKQAEKRLVDSETRLRRILEVNAEPTLLTDERGSILLANAAAAELLGRGEPTLAGSPLGLPLDSGRPAEVEVIRPDGELRTAEMRSARTRIGDSEMVVVSLHDLSERKKYERHIEHLANYDALTGLPNRNLLRDRAEQAIMRARREDRQLALLFVDLDRFKLINDSWGHPFGDQLLVETARRLAAAVREGDSVARLGGDEFVILLPELKHAENAIRVAEKVLAMLARPFEAEGRTVPVSASVGIANFPGDGETLQALLQSADAAMYRAKDLGRGGFQFYRAEMGQNARERAELEAALHLALERGELALYYQPQVDLATGRVVGFEALMRWTRPGKGAVSPAHFIPIAEESGLIVQMGDWALNTACRQATAWRDAGLGRYRVAVNLSARQFWQGRVVGSVAQALAASGGDPALLEVEITEGVVLRDVNEVMRSLGQLREMGVTVAIDDFGTGYSSLAYLRSLPIDKLKVDKAFLKGTPEDPDACAFVAEIIQLAHVLKLLVVAEGVEQEGQSVFLRHAGCERIQGFLFSPALDAASCEALLREDRVLT